MSQSQSKPQGAGKRWWLWLPLLGAGAWLALFGDKSPASDAALSLPAAAPAIAQASRSTAPDSDGAPPAVASLDSPLALVPRDQLFAAADAAQGADKNAARDLFSTRSWTPPPPPVKVEPPPPPVAPPLPYTFLGKKLEGEAWEVYLARGEQTFIARAGQVLEADWRVDKIAPPTLTVTYLPLGLPQTLSIGDTR
jgi:hypothetical protein